MLDSGNKIDEPLKFDASNMSEDEDGTIPGVNAAQSKLVEYEEEN